MQNNARFLDDHVTRLTPRKRATMYCYVCVFHGTRDGHPYQTCAICTVNLRKRYNQYNCLFKPSLYINSLSLHYLVKTEKSLQYSYVHSTYSRKKRQPWYVVGPPGRHAKATLGPIRMRSSSRRLGSILTTE